MKDIESIIIFFLTFSPELSIKIDINWDFIYTIRLKLHYNLVDDP